MAVTCTDACCILNLMNGHVLDVVAQLPDVKLCIQGLVEDEIGSGYDHVARLVSVGRFSLISGEQILASEVGAIAERYNIGLGESECIVIGKKFDYLVASDDRRARDAAASELGKGKVTGSIGLLISSINGGLISPEIAYASYKKMIEGGGFLPRLDLKFFTRQGRA